VPSIPVVDSRNLLRSQQAYQRIRAMVLSGELEQGSVVSEAQLVRELGMSRTPVREALRQLQAERLLDSAPGVGYIITELNEFDLTNIYMVRAALERLAASHAAARLTRADLGALEDLYEEMAVAVAKEDDAELARLNSRFHAGIARASGNSYLESMLDNIRETFERFRLRALALPGRRQDAHLEHGLLIEALKNRDGETAQRLAEAHVHRALEVRQTALATMRSGELDNPTEESDESKEGTA
jgi:DNA-binding GntR family transcriptional regulator